MNERTIKNGLCFIQSYLVALLPLCFIWLHNWKDVFFPEVTLWTGLLLLLTCIIYALFFFITKNRSPYKTELLTSTLLFFVLYFGYICSYNSWWFIFLHNKKIISLKILVPLWIIIGSFSIKMIFGLKKEYIDSIVLVKRRFIYIFLLILFLTNIPLFLFQDNKIITLPIGNFKEKPNIYYIILDAYPRQDTLKELYGYDNSIFIDQLKNWGFIICSESCSNYPLTERSIPAILSMEYLPYDKDTLETLSYSEEYLFKKNPVFALCKNNGYSLINISGLAYFTAHHPDAINISPRTIPITQFSLTFIDKTLAGPFLAKILKNDPCGENVIGQLANLEKIFSYQGPKFVFLHILSPHYPYYLDKNGCLRPSSDPDLMTPKGHLETISAINTKMLSFIKNIIKYEPSSIIILQSDHGSEIIHEKKFHNESNLPAGILKERMAILNGFYFPPSLRPTTIPADITSINTFRLVFSILTNSEISLLEEKIFYSPYFPRWGKGKVQILDPEEINKSTFIS